MTCSQLRRGIQVAAVALALDLASCGTPSASTDDSARGNRDHRISIPSGVQLAVHRTLHELPRICARGHTDARALEQATSRFIGYYKRYSSGRFRLRIDDESGTMLSAILVLRQELKRCSQSMVEQIDAVLPIRIRSALRPRSTAKP